MTEPEFSAWLTRHLTGAAERLGKWAYSFVRRHWLGLVNFHLLALVMGALLAPLIKHLNQQQFTKLIYGFYGFFCHQEPSRSFFLFNHQVAICSRCLAFYSSLLVCGLLISRKEFRPLSLKSAVLLSMPAVIDVLLQAVHLTESINLIRVSTGLLLGIAVSFYLFPHGIKAVNGLSREPRSITEEKAVITKV